MTQLELILQDMIRARVIDDRREYMPYDLQHAYGLTRQESLELYHMIQELFK